MKRVLYILFISLGLLFSACCFSPSFYKLHLEEEQKQFYMGREELSKEDKYAFANVSFEEQIGNDFNFFISVKNKSRDTILFLPEKIYMECFDEGMNVVKGFYDSIYAYDPEKKLDHIEKDIKSAGTTYNTLTGLNTVFGLVSTVSDIAGDHPEEVIDDFNTWSYNQESNNINYENKMIELRSQKDLWKNETLRKTTLFKDTSVGGLIFVKMNRKAKFVKIHVPVGKTEFTFLFKQVKV